MAYIATSWVDGVTPVNALNLNNLEAGLVTADGVAAAAVPRDGAIVAGTRVLANKLLSADAQPAFQISGDGKLQWGGGGANVLDTNLYRFGVNALATDGQFRSYSPSGFFSLGYASGAFRAYLNAADAQPSIALGLAAGIGLWLGPGGATAPDTSFVRTAARRLEHNAWQRIRRAVVGDWALTTMLDADASQERFILSADGRHQWGDGTAAPDVNLFRYAANILGTNDRILVARAAATDLAYDARVEPGDTASRFAVDAGGKLSWGPGNATLDVALYRSSADQLVTDDAFAVSLTLSSGTSMAANNYAYYTYVAGDTQPRFILRNHGRLEWGPGNAAPDTTLYRQGTGTLRTDGSLAVVQQILAAAGTAQEVQAGWGTGGFPTIIFNNSVKIQVGAGAPEGVITAPVGSLWLRTDGGASTTLYVKQSGAGNTGWIAK